MKKELIIDDQYKLVFEIDKNVTLLYQEQKAGEISLEKAYLTFLSKQSDFYYLLNFYVDELHQGKGFGNKMFQYLYENLPSEIYAILYLKSKILNSVQIPKILSKYNPQEVGFYEVIFNKNYKLT